MRPTVLASFLLLSEPLHALQAAYHILQVATLRRRRRPRIRLLSQAKASNQGSIAFIGFDASQFTFAVAFDAQGIDQADTIAGLMQAESQSTAIGAGGFQ